MLTSKKENSKLENGIMEIVYNMVNLVEMATIWFNSVEMVIFMA